MKIQRSSVVSVVLLLIILSLHASAADDRASIPQKLAESYNGKTVMVRGSYCGSSLEFDGSGKVLGGNQAGDWTICRDIRIDDLKMADGHLQISGRRVLWYFDPEKKRFREAPEIWPADAKKKEKKRYEKQMRSLEVSLRLEIPSDADQAQIESLLKAVFWPPDTAPVETASPLWTCYFTPKIKDCPAWIAPDASPEDRDALFKVGGDVKGPKPISAPDPNYSEAARGWKFQATNTFTIIVDREGLVHHVVVARPAGMGLDSQAAEKIATWKFIPAARAGVPVSVMMQIEVNFNLY